MATIHDKRTVDGLEGPQGLSGFVKANGVARVFDDGAHCGLVQASWNELRELAATGDQMMMVSMMHRPMVQAFMLQLEREKYPPGTPSNKNYRFYLGWWEDNMWAC